MAWTIEQVMDEAKQNGISYTREQAAFYVFCFNEAEKRNESPITVILEYLNQAKAKENLGKINTDNNSVKKETWQL